MLKPEDQFFITEIEVYISRKGKGVVDDRHIQTEEDFAYYQIDSKEKRYIIKHYVFSSENPARLYEGAIEKECYFASGFLKETRRYKRHIDNTYFKFYDDAEEVLNNIISFIKWLKNIPKLTKVKMKTILLQNEHLLLERASFPELEKIRQSQVGLPVKMRSSLKPLARDLQDELDLIQ